MWKFVFTCEPYACSFAFIVWRIGLFIGEFCQFMHEYVDSASIVLDFLMCKLVGCFHTWLSKEGNRKMLG